MQARWMFALLGVASVVGGLVQAFARSPELSFNMLTIAHTMGGIFGLFVISALIPAIWILFIRRKGPYTAEAPLTIGLVIAGVMTYLSLQGISVEREIKKSVYAPAGCSHKVTFPERPQLQELTLANGLRTVQASVASGESYIRAECIPTLGRMQKTTAEMEKQIKLYAQQNGLAPYEYRMETRSDGIYGFIRGSKTVSGNPIMYSLVLVLSDESFLGLLGGTRSSHFPTSVISDFLKSVELHAPK